LAVVQTNVWQCQRKFGSAKLKLLLPVNRTLTDYYRYSDNYLVPFRGLSLSVLAVLKLVLVEGLMNAHEGDCYR